MQKLPKKFRISCLLLAVAFIAATVSSGAAFTPLVPVPNLKVINSPAGIPGGNFSLTNLVDGNLKTEYASHDEGTNTFIELDFGRPTRLVAIRHVDRNDRATVAESRLELFDQAGNKQDSVLITHTNKPSGVTLFILPAPLTGTRARWQVTKLGNNGLFSVGGAELSFLASERTDASP